MKKITKIAAAFLSAIALTACGSNAGTATTQTAPASDNNTQTEASATTADFKKCTIGVALYQDAGPAPTATKAYLEEVGKSLNCDFKYVVLSSTDESVNLTKIQELISSNVDGIICTMDMGMPAIIEECEAAGVYLAGYLADYDNSYTQNYDKVFKSPIFCGTVADGYCMDALQTGHSTFESLMEYNEANPDNQIDHVSMVTFPVWAFPAHQVFVEQFVSDIDEYNKTAETPITVDPFNEETDVLQFSPMDSTYFTKHPDIDAVMSFCAGKFTYPTLISSGHAEDIKLFASGYEEGDCDNFGTKGTATYQQEIVSCAEAVNYPLIMLINKINGVQFPDQPETAERVSCSQLVMNSDADMDTFKNSIYLTGNAADALFTGEEVKNMTALNPNATYADLVESLKHMTIEDVAAK